jgi:hypothetical protein
MNHSTSDTSLSATGTSLEPAPQTRLDRARLLVGGYAALSLMTLAVIAFVHDPSVVDSAVSVRGSIVAATSLLMFAFASRAARGSRGGWMRLRIVAAVMLVAIVVIVALPGPFPVWMKVQQSVCGLLLLRVLTLANARAVRSAFH